MSQVSIDQKRPRTATSSAFTSPDIRPSGVPGLRTPPVELGPPETPPWSHRLLPPFVRGLLADLGWWQDPEPQPPSVHLEQTLAVLRKFGWCQSLDTTVTGRLCIRGAQNVLQRTGHVTPTNRDKAIGYMQQALAQAGISMQYFAWNDLPDQQFSTVEALLTRAARLARENGE
ncbi:DUF6197 family protein [Streptomyces sp. BE133]|uniref:DUF6197 family protein n=1 Tax=Streptomyces sp. BE133 TaxID=3002523 RepID=UPI002E786AE2|nr:hypothetical protein [Streptomyces sp. BE133]MEE1812600.1 hypothetical protein [Streptomyces sp. BE133]